MLRHGIVLISLPHCLCVAASAQTTTCVSLSSSGTQGNNFSGAPSISADGRYVAFESNASNLVPGDSNNTEDVFVRDLWTGTTTCASVNTNGTTSNSFSAFASISADGRFVVFSSSSRDLAPGDTNELPDIYVRDLVNGTTKRVSVDSSGAQTNAASTGNSAISADGRFVVFSSEASNLVPGDMNAGTDVFVHDMSTGTTTCASVDSSGVLGNGASGEQAMSISPDGRFVAFASHASNLVPGDSNLSSDVFVHDMLTGATTRVSVDSNGAQGNGLSGLLGGVSMSADGRFVAFSSNAPNLVPGDSNQNYDVFVHDRLSGTTTRVSVDSNGAQADDLSGLPSLSADGRYVAFSSPASNLVPGDSNQDFDTFVHDMATGTTTRVSLDSNGAESNGWSGVAALSISADGRYVAFDSYASNLIPSDANGDLDCFVRDRGEASAFVALCYGDGSRGACPCNNSGSLRHGCDNSASTGGALLTGTGTPSLSADTARLTSAGELPTVLSVVLQGNALIAPIPFGDGLRCAGGNLKRLYMKFASAGKVTAPEAGDPSISARSSALGDTIPLGATRIYQVYYRDSNLGFCPGGFNATNAVAIAWGA